MNPLQKQATSSTVFCLQLILTSVFLLTNIHAQEVELNGFVEVDHISYFENDDERQINSRNQGILQVELGKTLSEGASIFSAVEFREDQSDPLRNRFYLDEAYIDLYLSHFDFRLGKQIIVWGKADDINPTDNITPFDLSDFLDTDDERIGVVALKANYYVGNWTLEGIVVPAFVPSVLPLENSLWVPNFQKTIPNPMNPATTVNVSYDFQPPIFPDENFSNVQFAGKISTTLSRWDFSVSYFQGWDDLPVLHQARQFVSNDSLHITLQPIYHPLKVIGGDFSTTFGKFGLRGEAGYYLTDAPDGKDSEIDTPYFRYVLGVDRTFSNVIGDNSLFVLIQWIGEITQNGVEFHSDDLNHIFQRSIATRFEYDLTDFAKLSVQGAYNLKGRDYYVRPELSYQMSDGVNLNVSMDVLDGKEETFFGNYKDNKRLQVKAKYSF